MNSSDDFPAWIPLSTTVGMLTALGGRLVHGGDHAVTGVGVALLLAGAAGYFAHGGRIISYGKRHPTLALGGVRIVGADGAYTVLDGAVTGTGRRVTVTAVDDHGNVGPLSVMVDRHGRVTAIRATPDGPWTPAATVLGG